MIEMKKDVFDKIMSFHGLRYFNPFYCKYKEMLLYLFFGGCSFIINIISYSVANLTFGINELIANVIAWLLAVLFAFFTNRIWVFQSETHSAKEFAIQMMDFFCGRVVTLLIEEAIILIFITLLKLPGTPIKILAQIIVIVLNYVISKLWVFKNKTERSTS